MKKYLLTLVLISSQLFALEGIKFKIKQNENSIKFQVQQPYRGYWQKTNKEYLTQIIIESNGKLIYEILTSRNLPKNMVFKFPFKINTDEQKIKVIIIDNNNHKIQKTFLKNDIFNKVAIWNVVEGEIDKNSSL